MEDTLSDVLRAVRLKGALFFSLDASSPWVTETPRSSAFAQHMFPGAEHVIDYHVITSGACWGGLLDAPQVRLEAGDVIAFPQGDAHVLSSEPGLRERPDAATYRGIRERPLPITVALPGGGPERTQAICGFLGCDARPFNPLLSALPRMLHVREMGEQDSTLRRLVELALAESNARSPGGSCVLAHVSELLFVEVVRRYAAGLPPDTVGWFAGLRDDGIGRALQHLHQRPEHSWSLEMLAKQVGMSRSLLADRFAQLVGAPPMQYLAQWRIQLAASLLRSTTASLAEIANRVGYGSEAALSRAFKRWVGLAPAHYRRKVPTPARDEAAGHETSRPVDRPHSRR